MVVHTASSMPSAQPWARERKSLIHPPPLLNLRARLPDIFCQLWPVDSDSVPVSATSLCLQASISQVYEHRQAGGSRSWQGIEFHSQVPESAGQELGLQPKGAFLIGPTISQHCIAYILPAASRPMVP